MNADRNIELADISADLVNKDEDDNLYWRKYNRRLRKLIHIQASNGSPRVVETCIR